MQQIVLLQRKTLATAFANLWTSQTLFFASSLPVCTAQAAVVFCLFGWVHFYFAWYHDVTIRPKTCSQRFDVKSDNFLLRSSRFLSFYKTFQMCLWEQERYGCTWLPFCDHWESKLFWNLTETSTAVKTVLLHLKLSDVEVRTFTDASTILYFCVVISMSFLFRNLPCKIKRSYEYLATLSSWRISMCRMHLQNPAKIFFF